MRTGGLSILVATSLGLAGPALAAPLSSPSAVKPMIETVQYLPGSGFSYPHERGAIVDWCAVWANDCGAPAANAFCHSRGFDRALSWNIFQAGRTYVVGSHRYCEGGGCKGFRFIRCT
jgi:hypothetical protein